MKNEFVKDRQTAINHAMNNTVENYKGGYVPPSDYPKDDRFLIKDITLLCNCGETPGIEVTFFDPEDNQHISQIGICEHCSKE